MDGRVQILIGTGLATRLTGSGSDPETSPPPEDEVAAVARHGERLTVEFEQATSVRFVRIETVVIDR